MSKNDVASWQDSLATTYYELSGHILSFAPKLVGALALLFLGWLIATALRVATKRLFRGFDFIFKRMLKIEGARQEAIRRSYAVIASRLVFWVVMLFFITATTNMLGWNMFASWMSSIISYLPNLIAGLLIIITGFLVSNVARTGIVNTMNSAGVSQGETLARVAQFTILFTTLVVGIEQIGINVDFLTSILLVVVGVLLAGGTLAFALGAKDLVANIVGAQHFRKHCRIGEQLQIGAHGGNIVEITHTAVILDTDVGRTVIPAKYFHEQVTCFSSQRADTGESAKAETGGHNE